MRCGPTTSLRPTITGTPTRRRLRGPRPPETDGCRRPLLRHPLRPSCRRRRPRATRPAAPRRLHTVFGYEAFRGDQAAAIDQVIGGGDAVVLMPTGGGKSLIYQIPALVRPGTGLVVSPLIALMHDQVDALVANGVRAAYLNSTQAAPERAGRRAGLPRRRARPALRRPRAALAARRPARCCSAARSASSRSTRRTACRSGGTTSAPTTSRSATSASSSPASRASR